jgi:cytosine/adenosine deaminase-related metal-dependent hydrolase
MKLQNVILPGRDPKSRWNVTLESDTITSITPADPSSSPSTSSPGTPSSLLLPPLCHPHIHLDKAYILTCNSHHNPLTSYEAQVGQLSDYTDLTPQSGSFSEALTKTSQAKQRYTLEDLYLRGSQLLATSLTQGVTSCRAFVEVDHVTGDMCITTAISLKKCFAKAGLTQRGTGEFGFKLQICAFAQDPIFSTENGERNRHLLEKVLDEHMYYDGDCEQQMIEALGSTPYVERSHAAALDNIKWAIETGLKKSLHLDFHLDYNLDPHQPAMVWDVLRLLREANWNERARPDKTIVLGHCTRLTLFDEAEMARLAREIRESKLPVHFVGLPTSDLFMMGRPSPPPSPSEEDSKKTAARARANRPRGTLQVLSMIKDHGLNACLSVNNVGNAFTPWGTGDPLALASLGVGVYQAGTEDDAVKLYECVSTRARRAIGLSAPPMKDTMPETTSSREDENTPGEDSVILAEGHSGDILLIRNEEWVGCPGHLGMKIPARQRVSVRDVVWDPPDIKLRQILRGK